MRILIVHNHYQDWGGEDTVFQQEVNALKATNEVETLTFKNKKGLKGLVQFALYPYNIFAAAKLKKKIKEFKPQLVHIHNTHYASGPILFRVVKKMNLPCVFTAHNYRLACSSALLFFDGKMYTKSLETNFPWNAVKLGVLDNSPFKTFWTAFTYWLHTKLNTWASIQQILTLTQFAKNIFLEKNLGLKPENISVKPNFVEIPELTNTYKKESFFLCIGRLSEEKGIQVLTNQIADLPLKVIGDGPLKEYLPKRENIDYLGFKPKEEIVEYILKAKAVIIPSICLEGFPIVLQECLALKTPVIISDKIAASEIISDGINGFLIDPFEATQKLEKLYSQSDLNFVTEKAYELYTKSFTKEIVVNQLQKIYRDLINQTPTLNSRA